MGSRFSLESREKKSDRVIKHFRRTFPLLPGLAEREIDKSRFERATHTHTQTLLQAIFQRQSAGKAGLEKGEFEESGSLFGLMINRFGMKSLLEPLPAQAQVQQCSLLIR